MKSVKTIIVGMFCVFDKYTAFSFTLTDLRTSPYAAVQIRSCGITSLNSALSHFTNFINFQLYKLYKLYELSEILFTFAIENGSETVMLVCFNGHSLIK